MPARADAFAACFRLGRLETPGMRNPLVRASACEGTTRLDPSERHPTYWLGHFACRTASATKLGKRNPLLSNLWRQDSRDAWGMAVACLGQMFPGQRRAAAAIHAPEMWTTSPGILALALHRGTEKAVGRLRNDVTGSGILTGCISCYFVTDMH